MMSDLNDWKQNLTETEKNIVGSILKGFAQTETVVNDYWSGLVTKWFRKPEIIMMATTCFSLSLLSTETLLSDNAFSSISIPSKALPPCCSRISIW